MANLDSSSISNGGTIEASHITNLYDALTGTTTYDNISIQGDVSSATSSSYALTASYAANAGGASIDTGSFYISSSVNLNTITFTQGDGTTESVTVDTGSGGGGGGTADALAAGGELEGLTTASGHIIPSTDDTYDLGSAEYKFRDLYLSSGTLYMSGSGGWMSGSWDGTNFKINNNALIKSSVTSSMTVASATSAVTATKSSGFVYTGNDAAAPAQLSLAAGSAILIGGTVTINAFSSQLLSNRIGIDCFVTVTDSSGATSGAYTVSLTEGVLTISELEGGANDGQINYTIMYVAP